MHARRSPALAALFPAAHGAWLRRAVGDHLTLVADQRRALVPRVAGAAPSVLVVPVRDGEGIPTAPIVERCLLARPQLPVLAIEMGRDLSMRACHAVQRLGARILVAPTELEVRAAIVSLGARARRAGRAGR